MSKKTIMKMAFAVCFMCVCTAGLFADANLGALDTASEKMIDVISSKPVKVICVAGLLAVFGACIWGQTQGEGSFIKKLMPALYGIAGVLGTTGIVNWLFSGVTVDKLDGTTMIQNSVEQAQLAFSYIAHAIG